MPCKTWSSPGNLSLPLAARVNNLPCVLGPSLDPDTALLSWLRWFRLKPDRKAFWDSSASPVCLRCPAMMALPLRDDDLRIVGVGWLDGLGP